MGPDTKNDCTGDDQLFTGLNYSVRSSHTSRRGLSSTSHIFLPVEEVAQFQNT
jgi:hypothetical protein